MHYQQRLVVPIRYTAYSTILLFFVCWGQLLGTHSFKDLMIGHNSFKAQEWSEFSMEEQQQAAHFEFEYGNFLKRCQNSSKLNYRIPKKIHFIWLGPKPFPPESIENIISWKRNHPNWTLYFWTDSKSRPSPIKGMKRRLVQNYNFLGYESLINDSDNYGEKSDIMRYVILYKEGGIYVDHDCYCLRPFNQLNKACDFYASIYTITFHPQVGTRFLVTNCLIGARSQHPILLHALKRTKRVWKKVKDKFPGIDNTISRVIHRTFTSFALSALRLRGRNGYLDVLLPTAYFNPIGLYSPEQIAALGTAGSIYCNHGVKGTWHPNNR